MNNQLTKEQTMYSAHVAAFFFDQANKSAVGAGKATGQSSKDLLFRDAAVCVEQGVKEWNASGGK